jgi:hypothetical protein
MQRTWIRVLLNRLTPQPSPRAAWVKKAGEPFSKSYVRDLNRLRSKTVSGLSGPFSNTRWRFGGQLAQRCC